MLNYEFPPIGGGAANANRYILGELAGEGIEADLVTSSPEGYREESFSELINVYRVDVGKDRAHHWKQSEILRYMWKGFRKSRELEKENSYDVIHAWFGFPCGLMAAKLDAPYIVSLRGSDVPGYNERFSWQYKLLKPVIKYVWRSAEDVVPNSRGLKELAQETLDLEMDVIPNGVDTEKFRPDHSYSGERIELLCVSRLTPRKRISDVIKAVDGVEDVRLNVVGAGVQENELRELIRERGLEEKVRLRGHVSHEDLPEVYREADMFLMPSLEEGMSNTLLEAMASGLPVITTRTGGISELMSGNGTVVPKKDPGSIREAIQDYRNNPMKMSEEGRNSRERAEEMSWQKVAKQYIEKYDEVS